MPGACNSFFICVNGRPITQNCAPGLYWNQQQQICDWSHKVKCPSDLNKYDQLTKDDGFQSQPCEAGKNQLSQKYKIDTFEIGAHIKLSFRFLHELPRRLQQIHVLFVGSLHSIQLFSWTSLEQRGENLRLAQTSEV